MRLSSKIVILCLVSAVTVACARSVPLISHAHIGHSLTAWRDTPDQEGLFVVAEREAGIALEQAQWATQTAHTPGVAKKHISAVTHALNPDLQPEGPGLGYGAIRALEGAVDHIAFAAESKDASRNVIESAHEFSRDAQSVLDRLKVAVEVALLARHASAADLPGLAHELEQLIYLSINGEDVDGDGVIGATPQEAGLVQLRQGLHTMLANEEPPYHPLGRKYLLGLIRLPNGQWVYEFDHSARRSTGEDDYGYY